MQSASPMRGQSEAMAIELLLSSPTPPREYDTDAASSLVHWPTMLPPGPEPLGFSDGLDEYLAVEWCVPLPHSSFSGAWLTRLSPPSSTGAACMFPRTPQLPSLAAGMTQPGILAANHHLQENHQEPHVTRHLDHLTMTPPVQTGYCSLPPPSTTKIPYYFDEAALPDQQNHQHPSEKTDLQFILGPPDPQFDLPVQPHAMFAPCDTPVTALQRHQVDTTTSHQPTPEEVERENRRKRQRGYEAKYRKKKRVMFRDQRTQWILLELKLYELLRERAHAIHLGPSPTVNTYYHQLLREEDALRFDAITLRTLIAWQKVVEVRNYSESKPRGTRERWEAIQHQILGATLTKPYVPHRFRFVWE